MIDYVTVNDALTLDPLVEYLDDVDTYIVSDAILATIDYYDGDPDSLSFETFGFGFDSID